MVPQFLPAPTPGTPNPFDNLMIYVVQDADTLEDILERFGLNLEDFLRINRNTGTMLMPGSTIRIPQQNRRNGIGIQNLIEPEEEN